MKNLNNSGCYNLVVIPEDIYKELSLKIESVESLLRKESKGCNSDDLLSVKDVLNILKISARHFQTLRDQKKITFSQDDRKIYVRRGDLDKYIEDHRIV